MTVTISPSLDDVFTALRAFLIDVLGTGIEVFQTQDNRVPEPPGTDFVAMTPVRFPRLGTDYETLDNTGLQAILSQPQEFVMQLDVHGHSGYDNISKITTMFRSSYGVDFFASLAAPLNQVAPLYHSDPHQMPFHNAEQQYEDRYVLELSMQVNLTATTITQSAQELSLNLTNVDTAANTWPNSTITVP